MSHSAIEELHDLKTPNKKAQDQENKPPNKAVSNRESTESPKLAVRSMSTKLETPRNVCDICGKRFSTVFNCRIHRKTHGEKLYACDMCSHKSHNLRNLRQHRMIHTGERPFSCNQCDYQSRQKDLLLFHTINQHKVPSGGLKNEEILNGTSANQENKQPNHSANIQKCAKTPKIATKSALRNLETARNACDICGKTFNYPSDYKNHRIIHKEKTLACTYSECSYKCHRPAQLRQHESTHSSKRPFTCEQCGLTYKTKQGKDYHIRVKHNVQPADLENCISSANSNAKDEENKQPDNSVNVQEHSESPKTSVQFLMRSLAFSLNVSSEVNSGALEWREHQSLPENTEYACDLNSYKTDDPSRFKHPKMKYND